MKKNIFFNKTIRSTRSSLLNSRPRYFQFPYLFSEKGFTFIEVVMVMVIIGIVCTIAVPSMTGMMKSYRLKSAANDLASTLQLARLTAISQNAHSVINFDTTNQIYSVFSDNGEGGGTLNDGTQSGAEPTIKTINIRNEYTNEVTMSTPSFGGTNFFNSQGGLKDSAAGSIVLQNTSGESIQVVISQGGAIKIIKS